MGIDAVSGSRQAQPVKKTTVKPATKQITVPVGQSTPEEVKDPTLATSGSYAASKINNVETKIQEQKLALVNAKPADRAHIEAEIKRLQEQKTQQDTKAALRETSNGQVKVTMKQKMNVEEFKRLFDIGDGVLAYNKDLGLKPRYVDNPNDPEGHQMMDWSQCDIPEGKSFNLQPEDIDNQGFFKETFNRLRH